MTDSSSRARRAAWVALALTVTLLLLACVFWLSHRATVSDLRQAQAVQTRFRVQALENILIRQRAVATVLADDALVREMLHNPTPANRERVSRKLDYLKNQTESAVIYVLNNQGVAVSASNWDESTSFVGVDYSFRDYFSEALLTGEATQFALGTVSNRAGLYLSDDIVSQADGRDLGVVVVKVEFDHLEQGWQTSEARTDVLNGSGQLILSSDPVRRFEPAPVPKAGEIATSALVPGTDWVLTVTAPGRPAVFAALFATGTAGFALTLIGAGAGLSRRARRRAADERRYRADLERAVDQRTQALQDEMNERQAVEARLEELRAEMVQANKLAALGQITAGVAHEVNQPLATIRLLAENGRALLESGDRQEVLGNLSSIERMTGRITRITDHLRGFARKTDGQIAPVRLAEAVEVALLLTDAPRQAQGIRLDLPEIPDDLRVSADAVALEQILVNLLQNAQEALAGRPDPRITVTLDQGALVRLTISDNGPGLAPAIAEQLFTPFVTSKPRGMGLGLVISQDLARGFDGSLRAAPQEPGRGATFILELHGIA
jgi:two-component system C4-dicarboxylate transport sensor histidine kinase DctB